MFYVYGEVNRPGSYRLERGMTLRHALARGGGPTQRGSERNLRLHRRGADHAIHLIADPRLDEPVRPEDVLHVGESLF
jgi:polysaccharide export outer membrane protein